jgi:hypothetical protein
VCINFKEVEIKLSSLSKGLQSWTRRTKASKFEEKAFFIRKNKSVIARGGWDSFALLETGLAIS